MLNKKNKNVENADIMYRFIFKDKEQGITLVALLITIIIMIILAAITIKVIFDVDFINLATKSVENYAGAGIKELNEMNNTVDRLENTIDKIQTASPNGAGGGNKKEEEIPAGVEANGSWNGKVNTPKLAGTGMQAVYWKDDGTEVILSKTSSKAEWENWYDYADTSQEGKANTSKWANAVTKNKDGEITGYWVWIPRYEYKIDTTNKTIDVKFKQIGESTTEGFTIHPAFKQIKSKEAGEKS